jgi:hypothetical protein
MGMCANAARMELMTACPEDDDEPFECMHLLIGEACPPNASIVRLCAPQKLRGACHGLMLVRLRTGVLMCSSSVCGALIACVSRAQNAVLPCMWAARVAVWH